MNKTQFTKQLAANLGITQKQAGEHLAATLDLIQSTVASGDSIQFIGFGTFKSATRSGKAPGTGKPYSTVIPQFKAGAVFKAALN